MRVLIAKSLHYLYQQQYQAEPPHRATRVRDLTFLPHLLEIGKPLKNITIQDLASKVPSCNQPNLATVLQQQIEQLSQTEWYHQCEEQVLKRLACQTHDTAASGEAPTGGPPPLATNAGPASQMSANQLTYQEMDRQVVNLPPATLQALTRRTPTRRTGGGRPLAANPKPPRHAVRGGYPLVVPPKKSRDRPAGGGCPLVAHPELASHCEKAGHPLVVPHKQRKNKTEEARQDTPPQLTPSRGSSRT